MRFVNLLGFAAATFISTAAQAREPASWCFQGTPPGMVDPDHARGDVSVWPVRPERMAAGANALRERSVVELDAGAFFHELHVGGLRRTIGATAQRGGRDWPALGARRDERPRFGRPANTFWPQAPPM